METNSIVQRILEGLLLKLQTRGMDLNKKLQTTLLQPKPSPSVNWPQQQRISGRNVCWAKVDLDEFIGGNLKKLVR